MGSMFRGEQMALAQLFVQPEAAYLTVSEFGEVGIIEFRDLNEGASPISKKFLNEIQRCEEMERKLRYMKAELQKARYIIIANPPEKPRAPNPKEIGELEGKIDKTENDVRELTENAVSLRFDYLELIQFQLVLEKTNGFFSNPGEPAEYRFQLGEGEDGQLTFVAGVIDRERLHPFERMLWRVSRGNVFLKQAEIEEPLEDPVTGNTMEKAVFMVFFQGESLKMRVMKVCEGFRAKLYNVPDSRHERNKMLSQLNTRIDDLKLVLYQTEDIRRRVLMSIAREIKSWMIMVKKMKATYYTLNMFNRDVTNKCFIGEGWVPVNDIDQVTTVLTYASEVSGSSMPSFVNIIRNANSPPTYIRTNKFTKGFQNLIDSYGVASYREANPALYTIVTFPFLFAIMFGDMGHAFILMLVGLYLVMTHKKRKKGKNEVLDIFYAGRYIILMMGIYSMYTGFIYNDIFSQSLNLFGSSWKINWNHSTISGHNSLQLDPKRDYSQYPPPIGMDPVWDLAINRIIFLNSYKMKLSIIFGVTHMMFGVCVGLINYIHFRQYASIVLEFLPQLIFLMALFLWLVVMVFLKWILYSPNAKDLPHTPGCAPSVLILFIDMMLFSSTPPKEGCKQYLFRGQHIFQQVLVFAAILCIPVMLLGKPLYVLATRKHEAPPEPTEERRSITSYVLSFYRRRFIVFPLMSPQVSKANVNILPEEEQEELSEVFIHQAIHTIEYVLSTISHTASYLRLWALSLAHAQLSEVLWNMVLQKSFIRSTIWGGPLIFAVFALWAFFTVAILVLMEGLSAFLHTLRLHWVEFMSKFYSGMGHLFEPFYFKTILGKDNEE